MASLSPCPPKKGHRRTHSDVPIDPRRALDAASVRSTENRGLYRKGALSSRSSSTAASPPAFASSLSSSRSPLATVDKYAYLHNHILSLVEKVSLTESEALARTQVIQTIQDAVSRYNAGIIAEPFGSFCTGLSLASSDVDIVLTYTSCSPCQPYPASKMRDSCAIASSGSAASSQSSFKFISSDDDRSSNDNGSLSPLDENEGNSPSPSAQADTANQAGINWWDIPPPDQDLPNILENQLAAASHEPVDCSAVCQPSDPVGAASTFSFDDIPAVLQACPRSSNLRYIKTAKIPIIKLVVGHDVPNVDPISVDITCALRRSDAAPHPVPGHSGVGVREFVKLVLRDYPSIRPVVMVMKVVLSNRGLSNPYRGGLGSYPLFIMAYYWTRFRNQSGECVKFGREGEEALILDWEPAKDSQDAVGHFHPKATPRADFDLPQPAFTPTVVIMDPLNPGTNVAASAFAFWRVRALFMEMRDYLVKIPSKKVSVLQPLSLNGLHKSSKGLPNNLIMFVNGAHLGSTGGVDASPARVTSAEADSLIITKESPEKKGSHRRAASLASTSSLASQASTVCEDNDQ